MSNEKIVYVVHCVDTEGPLYEPISATFERIELIFDLTIPPTHTNLILLQKKKYPGINDELANAIYKVVLPELINYNDSWDKIDKMISVLLSEDFRGAYKDSFDGIWRYSWHCMDHVGFNDVNPRGRDIGYHKVFDRYKEYLSIYNSEMLDELSFHYHPVSMKGDANLPATSYFSYKPEVFNVLARKIIDRKFFPSSYRPGFHTTRPDSHWFLEQYIPFEYANQRVQLTEEELLQKDISGNRFGDWNRAPLSWLPYKPSHDDYQIKGDCRRMIARCLNVGTRLRLLSQNDVDLAFQEADSNGKSILAFTNHDFRDMTKDVLDVMNMLKCAEKKFENVKFKYSTSTEAFKHYLNVDSCNADVPRISFDGHKLYIEINQKIFGPQPFLALKTKVGTYFHDNFDIIEPFKKWSYTFDEITFKLESLSDVFFAYNDMAGNVFLVDVINEKKYKNGTLF